MPTYQELVRDRKARDQERQALVARADGLLAKEAFTPEDEAEVGRIKAQLERQKTRLSLLDEQIAEALKAPAVRDPSQPLQDPPRDQDDPPPNRWRSFGEQMMAVARASRGVIDPRLTYQAATGLSEGVPSDGGYLVEKDFVSEILRKIHETRVLWSRTRNIPVGEGRNGVRWPYVDETSRATGSRLGGVRGYWVAEGVAATASKPKLARLEWEFKKLAVLIYGTDELLGDATALGGFLGQAAAEELGFMLDDAIVRGDGVGKPLGLLNALATVSVAKETGQAASTVVAENIEKMFARMWSKSVPRATWYMNQAVWPQIFQLHHVVGTAGVPMFIPPGALTQAPLGLLLGRPIEVIEQADALGTVGDIIFADLSEYGVIDKGGVEAATSIHVKFVEDETAFRFILRVDGQPMWVNKLTPYKGADTISPYITLATRA